MLYIEGGKKKSAQNQNYRSVGHVSCMSLNLISRIRIAKLNPTHVTLGDRLSVHRPIPPPKPSERCHMYVKDGSLTGSSNSTPCTLCI
jgi:hypothetical protein